MFMRDGAGRNLHLWCVKAEAASSSFLYFTFGILNTPALDDLKDPTGTYSVKHCEIYGGVCPFKALNAHKSSENQFSERQVSSIVLIEWG